MLCYGNKYTLKCKWFDKAKANLSPTSQTNVGWKDFLGTFHKSWLWVLTPWDNDIFKTHKLCIPNGRGKENQDKEHKPLIASPWKSHKCLLLPIHWPEFCLLAGRLRNASPQITVSATRALQPSIRDWLLWHLGQVT